MKYFEQKIQRVMFAAAMGLAALSAQATTAYPTKPINLIIPAVPGGILDSIGRFVMQGLEKMGQPVVLQFAPGAGGSVGSGVVARAPADGYTVGMVASSHAINPSLYAKLPFDTQKDFITVSHAVDLTNVLVVNKTVPARTLAEFIALAKQEPGKFSCGSAGNGQSNHLSLEMFNMTTGVKLTHIPYKGSAAALNDVLGGSLNCMFVDMLSAKQHIASGALRPLALSSAERQPELPDVPTFKELGINNFSGSSWLAVVVRAGTPKEIVEKLNQSVQDVMKDPEVRKRLISMGVVPVGSSLEDSRRFMDQEIARYATAVKGAGLKID